MSCGLHVLFPVSSAARRTPHVRENLFRCVHSDAGSQRNWFKCQKSISSTHPLDDQDHLKTKMVKGAAFIFRQKCKILFLSRNIWVLKLLQPGSNSRSLCEYYSLNKRPRSDDNSVWQITLRRVSVIRGRSNPFIRFMRCLDLAEGCLSSISVK